MRQPPGAATWLLTHLAPSTPASVIGDLQEEYEAGRSTEWYWRQIFRAIVSTTTRHVTVHPIVAARAVFVGWAFLWIFFEYCFGVLVSPGEWLFVRGIADVRSWWPNIPTAVVVHIMVPLVCAGSGWIVARFHKRELVLIFVMTVLAWNLMGTIRALIHGWMAEGFLIALVWNFVEVPMSILLGGVTTRREAVE